MKKHLLLFSLMGLFLATLPAMGQTTTSGDVAGVLTDATGAAIPGAQVKVTNIGTGDTKTVTSSAAGNYRVSQLSPGTYKVSATASGFATTENTVTISVGTVLEDNLKLSVGQQGTTVEVSSASDIVNTTNADTVTTISSLEVQALPNPGNDLTFVAQTAPGTVMNTGTAAGGYGNFSSFGISGLSNMFTLDGGYENDPFLNLNNTGASNLTLGNNEVDTVTVVAPAFSSQFGGLGGARVNESTLSGTNRLHGNLSYFWDGSSLNSNDFFNKQQEVVNGTPNKPQFVNANQWGASIGGPIIKDRLFWFVNTEGIRATTPQQGTIFAPSPAVENCARGGDPGNATYVDCATLNAAVDAAYAADPSNVSVGVAGNGDPFVRAATGQLPQLNRVFATFDNSPFRPAASQVHPYADDPASVTYFASAAELLTEWLLTARVDYKISDKDTFFIHYKEDHGTQPTYTDVISPLFTDQSPQPAYEGQANETHTFTPNLTNQLIVTGNWYSAPFQNNNPSGSVLSAAPSTVETLNGGLSNSADYYGGINYDFPQGRRVAGYQVIDDVAYTKGRNTLRFGYNLRRDNITDIQGIETTYPLSVTYEEDFYAGITSYEYVNRFPQRPTQPVRLYNMGAYVEDTFKAMSNLTITAGLRIERDSNPVCLTNCFSALAYDTSALPTTTATTVPYSSAFPGGLIQGGRRRAFRGNQLAGIMPRIAFNYQATPKTTVRAGFGMFTDSPPGLIADTMLSNAPDNFHAVVYAPYSGVAGANNFIGYDNTVPGGQVDPNYGTVINGKTVATASASAFQTGFAAGQTETQVKAAVAATGAAFSTPSISTTAAKLDYPTYEEYSFAIERRLDSKSSVQILYVGNHGYHEPVSDATRNLSNSKASATYFPTIPVAKPIGAFATVTNIYTGASSNYNGVVVSAVRHSKDLTLQFNYQFSKALDEISNGGLEPFAPDAGDSASLVTPGNLHANYGPADYNVKHNVTGAFVYELPVLFKGGSDLVRALVGGFEFSGDVFHNSGLPYSITQSTSSTGGAAGNGLTGAFANGGILLLAHQLNNSFDHHCGGSSHVENVALGTVANPCDYKTSFTAPTNFGQQSRNSLIGPSYTNVNLGAFKTFGVPLWHVNGAKLKLGAQFFNLFNHTNFQNPSHARGSSIAELGGISSTVGAPTSILGSTGGADASPRLIQLHGSFVF